MLLTGLLAACGGARDPGSGGQTGNFRPIDPSSADLWDRQTTETGALLQELVATFNESRAGLPVKIVHNGGYGDIYRKITASLQARTLPAMAVAYETMTVEFIRKGAAVRLDPYIEDPETGFTPGELADFFPSVLETNRFPEFGGGMYSFPYTKSVLILYYNRRVLAKAGIQEPPQTWSAFLDQARKVKAATGNPALSLNVSASTLVGMIYSMGGDILSDGASLFDRPESVQVFELLETMVREGLIYQNPPGTYEDQTAFGQDRLAFNLRSSASLTLVRRMMEDSQAWGVSIIPQKDPERPATVLYGANICIFDTTDEHKDAAWAFIRYFTSPEVNARWAMRTGYLPLRRSAAQSPAMLAYFSEQPQNRVPFDCLAHARPEPNVAGWQETRGVVENAVVAVLTKMKGGAQAAADLKLEADRVLSRAR